MKLVSPNDFSIEQKNFVKSVKDSVSAISFQTDIVLGFKDIHSRHIGATRTYAKLVGLADGADVTGRLDCEMPCEGTAQFSDCYVREDRELLYSSDFNQKKSTLNIHEYSHGLDALIFEKYLLKHHASQSILGIIYTAHKMEISKFLSLVPNYVLEFGTGRSIEAATALIAGDVKLTDYEHEVCFLLVMNWDFKQIAQFMDKHRPSSRPRSRDAIYKCRNRVCERLECHPAHLRAILVDAGIHRNMPTSFFCRIIGSKLL